MSDESGKLEPTEEGSDHSLNVRGHNILIVLEK